MPNSITEGGAPGTATLTRTGDVSQVLRVNLSSSDTTEATIQTAVIFDNFVTKVSVPISPVDDAIVDGTQTVTITANGTATQGLPFAIDTSYGVNGLASTRLDQTIQPPFAAIAIQPDGKVIVAGENGGSGWNLQRFNTNGTLDTTFGGGLVQTTGIGSFPVPHKAVVLPNGQILVGGEVASGTGSGILVKYNANGTLDTSFGVSGKADLSRLTNAWVTDIAVRPDGRILLGLSENGSVMSRVAQLNLNGTFDSTFGTQLGVTALNLGYTTEHVEILPDGTFLAGGSFRTPVQVAKVNANGVGLVSSFGTNGIASLDFGTGGTSVAGMIVDGQGRIVIGADVFDFVSGTSTPANFAAGRLNPNGTPDVTFAGDGTAIIDVVGSELATSVVLQQDGKIVVGGRTSTSTTDSALARFNADGTPDTTFDGDGYFRQSLTSTFTTDTIFNMVLQDDGKLLALTGWANDMRVARFHMGVQTFPLSASDMIDVLDNDTAVNQPPVAVNDAYTVGEDGALVVSAPTAGTASGPVLRYGFDEASSGNGTALDSGTYPPGNASLQLAASRTGNTPGGASRGALDLNSPVAAAYATAGDVNKVDGLPALTVTVWVNLRGTARDNQVILSDVPLSSDGANTGGWDLTFTTFGGVVSPQFLIHEKDSPGSSHASGKILTGLNLSNQWVFMAFTYTASQLLTTFNGSETSAVTQNGGSGALGIPLRGNSAPLSIGRASDQTSTFASNPLAWIDDVRIYDRALTQAELEAVRQQGITSTKGVMTNDSDPDGDTLTASVVTGPSNGSLTFFPDGNFHYIPNPNFNGTDSFTYRVSDGALQSAPATVSVTVTPTNDAPVAVTDSYTTTEDTPLTVPAPGLLANDTDVDGDNLTFGRIVVPLQPEFGTVAVNPNGSFTFTPAPNLYSVGLNLPADSFSFAYTVTDGKLESAPIVVRLRVNPVNDPPVANDDSASITEDGGSLPISVLANDSLQIDDLANKNESLAILSFSQPANGIVVQLGTQLIYTPNTNFFGTDTFNYTVTDSTGGGTDTAMVTITVPAANDPPDAVNDAVSTPDNAPVTIAVLANDSDVDSSKLTIVLASLPAHGLTIVNPDGTITYTPDGTFAGKDTFFYTITDEQGALDTATVEVQVLPRLFIDDATVTEGDAGATIVSLSFRLSLANPDGASVVLATADGTAKAPGDYQAVTPLPVSFIPGETSLTILLSIEGDTVKEPNETFFVNLSSPIGAIISDGQGVVTILNDDNIPPVAGDDSATTPDNAPVTVSVLANDTDADGDALIVTGASDPAHGVTKVNADGTVTYTPDGNFAGTDTFTYTVSDGSGGTDTATVAVRLLPRFFIDDVTVTEGNSGPTIAGFTVRLSNVSPDTITVVGSTANGTAVAPGDYTAIASSTGIFVPGITSMTFAVTVQGDTAKEPNETFFANLSSPINAVIDDGQAVGTILDDDNAAPVANDDSASTVEDTAVVIDVLANDTDIENDTLTIAAVGTPNKGGTATIVSGKISYTPAANFNGTETFTYTVSDGKGGMDTATVSVTVTPVNDAPVAQSRSVSTNEDAALNGNVAATDVDGPSLSFVLVSGPANGTLVLNGGTGAFTYTPSANYNGPDSFTFRASDGSLTSNTATVSITVTPVNDAPVASLFQYGTAEDTPLNETLRASDVDGNALTYQIVSPPAQGTLTITNPSTGAFTYTPPLNFNGTVNFTFKVNDGTLDSNIQTSFITVAAVNDAPVAQSRSVSTNEDAALNGNVAATDVDGPSLSFVLVSGPANGTLVLNGGTGAFTYTPSANYNGPDSFTFRASDGSLTSNTATVSITVTPINDAPVGNDDTATVAEDSGLTFLNPLGNDTDVDLDSLTLTAVGMPNQGGTAVINGGKIAYTPAANFNGTESFTYTISDGNGGTDTATFVVTVTPVNDAPTANDDAISVAEDSAATLLNVLDNDSIAPDSGETLSVTAVTQPANGTVTVTTATSGVVRYTPALNFNGTDSFTYTISDGNGGTDTATVFVTVRPVNDAPDAVNDAATVSEDSGTTALAVLGNDTDVDGDTVTLSAVGTPNKGGTATIGGGQIHYTPAPNFNGTETISYTISDGKGGTDTATLTVTVTPVNDAPVAKADSFATDEDSPLSGALFGIDVDGDSLAWAVVNGPTHGSLVLTPTGGFTYTPNANYNGPDSFTFKVNDGTVDSNIATASIAVRPVNDAPAVDPATFGIAENSPNGTAVGSVTANDIERDALSYSITGGNTGGAFAIDPTSGAITVANSAALNFEATPFFNLTVQVRDGAGGTGTATIRINLTDVPEELEVAIDVKPGDGQNRINSKSNGKLEVAILSTASFDVQLIDIDSLRFGLTGTENSISQRPNQGPRFRYEDVNGDGRLDLVVRFEIELTGLQPDSTKAILNGSLLDGTSFTAVNDVSMR